MNCHAKGLGAGFSNMRKQYLYSLRCRILLNIYIQQKQSYDEDCVLRHHKCLENSILRLYKNLMNKLQFSMRIT